MVSWCFHAPHPKIKEEELYKSINTILLFDFFSLHLLLHLGARRLSFFKENPCFHFKAGDVDRGRSDVTGTKRANGCEVSQYSTAADLACTRALRALLHPFYLYTKRDVGNPQVKHWFLFPKKNL